MKKNNSLAITAIAAIVSIATPAAYADGAKEQGAPAQTEAKKNAAKPYPLDTCVVSGDKLGEMGKPVVFNYKGQDIKLCCKDCRKDFDKDPAKYLKKLVKK